LAPALIEGAKTSSDGKARITFAASIVQTKAISWDTLTDTPARKKLWPEWRYGQSKFVRGLRLYFAVDDAHLFLPQANVVLAREFARRYGDKGLVFTSMDPGKLHFSLSALMISL